MRSKIKGGLQSNKCGVILGLLYLNQQEPSGIFQTQTVYFIMASSYLVRLSCENITHLPKKFS